MNFHSKIDKENKHYLWFWLESFSIFAATFNCHFNIPDFYGELKYRNIENFRSILRISFFVVTLINVFLCICAYLTFGSGIEQDCLNSLNHDSYVVGIARLTMVLALVGTYPLLFFQIKHSLHYTLFYKEEIVADFLPTQETNNSNIRKTSDENETEAIPLQNRRETAMVLKLTPTRQVSGSCIDGLDDVSVNVRYMDASHHRMAAIEDVPRKGTNAFTISLVYLIITCGIWIFSIESSNIVATFLSLMMAFIGDPVTFIFPPLMYYKIIWISGKEKENGLEKFICYCLGLFGLIVSVGGVVSVVMNLIGGD